MTSLEDLVKKYAQKHSIDPALLYSLIRQESAGKNGLTSNKNAMGLGQIIPSTFQAEASKLGIKNPDVWNPEHNLDVAASYLKQQLDQFGNTQLALAAYNAGPSAVKKYAGIPPYRETRNYVARISESLKDSAAKLASGIATPIVDARKGKENKASSTSVSPAPVLPPASDYEGILNQQLGTLKQYLNEVEGKISEGNRELKEIDKQQRDQMLALLNRVNYNPMNPDSAGSKNVAELARLSEVLRNTEIAREAVGRAGLFDNPAAFIEKTLFGNPYTQGAKDVQDAISRLNFATAAVDERLKSQAAMAKEAYITDPSVVRADMESALRIAEIAKDIGLKESELPLKAEQLKLDRYNAELNARNSDIALQRSKLELDKADKEEEIRKLAEAEIAKLTGDPNTAYKLEASNKLMTQQRLAEKNAAALEGDVDANAEKLLAEEQAIKYMLNKVDSAKAKVNESNSNLIAYTQFNKLWADFYSSANISEKEKADFALVDIKIQTEKLKAAIANIEAVGEMSRVHAKEALADTILQYNTIKTSNALNDERVNQELQDLNNYIKHGEAVIKAKEVEDAQKNVDQDIASKREADQYIHEANKDKATQLKIENETLDKAVIGATSLGAVTANKSTIYGWKPDQIVALANAANNGFAGNNSYESALIMSSLGILNSKNATSPNVEETWNKLKLAMQNNFPEDIAQGNIKDKENYIATASQSAFENAALKSSAKNKDIDSSSALRNPTNVYSLPTHNEIMAFGGEVISKESKEILDKVPTKIMESGSAINILEAIKDVVPNSKSSIYAKPSAKKVAALAFTEYMKAGIFTANKLAGYEKLGLPKMTSEHLKLKSEGLERLSFNTKIRKDTTIDLTDPADVVRLNIGLFGTIASEKTD